MSPFLFFLLVFVQILCSFLCHHYSWMRGIVTKLNIWRKYLGDSPKTLCQTRKNPLCDMKLWVKLYFSNFSFPQAMVTSSCLGFSQHRLSPPLPHLQSVSGHLALSVGFLIWSCLLSSLPARHSKVPATSPHIFSLFQTRIRQRQLFATECILFSSYIGMAVLLEVAA